MMIRETGFERAALVWSRHSYRRSYLCFNLGNAWWYQVAPKTKERVLHAALTPATKVFTSLDSCSACFDTSDAAVKT